SAARSIRNVAGPSFCARRRLRRTAARSNRRGAEVMRCSGNEALMIARDGSVKVFRRAMLSESKLALFSSPRGEGGFERSEERGEGYFSASTLTRSILIALGSTTRSHEGRREARVSDGFKSDT